MRLQGQYRITFPSGKEIILPNNLVDEGEEAFMKMILLNEQGDVSGGGNFYLGMMGASFAEDTTLATLSGEPTSTGGYARIAVERNSTGWPTIDQVSGKYRGQSKQVSWTASGADFSTSFSRLFLCSVASGTSGILISVSAALSVAALVADGETYSARYELYIN